MKSYLGSAAAMLAAISTIDQASALDHPLLASTDDFVETWTDKPKKKDMIRQEQERRDNIVIDHNKRPVVGVLTEPIRGDLFIKGTEKGGQTIDGGIDRVPGYVPRAHVQFLEQAGMIVVPVDYRLSRDELVAAFDQVNALYMPGDSQLSVTNQMYKDAFVIAMAYTEHEVFEKHEHFPVFMMGNSLSTWIRSKQKEQNVLTEMKAFKHSNSRLDLVQHPEDTYLFNKMTREEKKAVFNTAQFFNMQTTGLRPVDLVDQNALKEHMIPLALFSGHGIDNEDEKFIAIAEGSQIPLYAFTYGVEMVQFYFEDPSETLDNFMLDHSIIARKHAQTVANLIAAEARMNDHTFAHEESVFESLIRHEELAKVTYGTNAVRELLPEGMREHEIYILH